MQTIYDVHLINCLFCVQDGETFLHLALLCGDFKKFTFLLGSLAEVDVNSQDKVVHYTVDYGTYGCSSYHTEQIIFGFGGLMSFTVSNSRHS